MRALTSYITRKTRFIAVLFVFVLGLVPLALPAHAEEYDDALDKLSRLQTLANSYISEGHEGDAVVLTLAYTRTGDYNSTIWQLTAGARDPEFENYVAAADPDLANLQTVTTVSLPNGETIDFGHLLASLNLVYKGIPITGSWGGDCMQLAQVYAGQAPDATGYVTLMQQTFGIADDGSVSKFGDQDLRADLDSINIGASLASDSNLADLLRGYYENLTDYDRAYRFIALSFGNVDTGSGDFPNTVYNSLVSDTGMQLLLYMNSMWTSEGSWQIAPDAEPALRGACTVFANYLSATVNNERVKSDQSTLMHTSATQALSDALTALGDTDAAAAALATGDAPATSDAIASTAETKVDVVLTDATETLRGGLDARTFETILLIVGAAALLGLIGSIVMMLRIGRGTHTGKPAPRKVAPQKAAPRKTSSEKHTTSSVPSLDEVPHQGGFLDDAPLDEAPLDAKPHEADMAEVTEHIAVPRKAFPFKSATYNTAPPKPAARGATPHSMPPRNAAPRSYPHK